MNGIHDLGGMHGFGPVDPEPNEPVFHHEWERRAFALNLATSFLGRWNIDMGRYAREHMPPAAYLATTYYEHWLYGLERLLVEKGLVAAKELQTMRPHGPGPMKALGPADVPKALRNRRAARDKVGVIERDHGVFIFADAHAATGEKVPQHCYAVRFEGREWWGADAGPRDAVYVDCFEPYLEPA